MKKINSIGYGGKILGVGLGLTILLPIAARLASLLSGAPVFLWLGNISFGCGVTVFIGLAVLLAIELRQDRTRNQHHLSNRNQPRALESHKFECAACGNRQVRPQDTSCAVCGIHFKWQEEASENQ